MWGQFPYQIKFVLSFFTQDLIVTPGVSSVPRLKDVLLFADPVCLVRKITHYVGAVGWS